MIVSYWWYYGTFFPCYCSKKVSNQSTTKIEQFQNCTNRLVCNVPFWVSSLERDRRKCHRKIGCSLSPGSLSTTRSLSTLCDPSSLELYFPVSGHGILCCFNGFLRLPAAVHTCRNELNLLPNLHYFIFLFYLFCLYKSWCKFPKLHKSNIMYKWESD